MWSVLQIRQVICVRTLFCQMKIRIKFISFYFFWIRWSVPLFSEQKFFSHRNPGAHFASASISLHSPHIASAVYERNQVNQNLFLTKHHVTHLLFGTSDNILHSRSHPSIRRPHNRLVWRTIGKHLISCTRPTMQMEFQIRGIHWTESHLHSEKQKTKSRLTQIWTFFRVFCHPKW